MDFKVEEEGSRLYNDFIQQPKNLEVKLRLQNFCK